SQINSVAVSTVYSNRATAEAAKAIMIEIKKKKDEIGRIEK
ncbi:12169_t:CDS:1, partial [Funneliformis geosporum]